MRIQPIQPRKWWVCLWLNVFDYLYRKSCILCNLTIVYLCKLYSSLQKIYFVLKPRKLRPIWLSPFTKIFASAVWSNIIDWTPTSSLSSQDKVLKLKLVYFGSRTPTPKELVMEHYLKHKVVRKAPCLLVCEYDWLSVRVHISFVLFFS